MLSAIGDCPPAKIGSASGGGGGAGGTHAGLSAGRCSIPAYSHVEGLGGPEPATTHPTSDTQATVMSKREKKEFIIGFKMWQARTRNSGPQ
jgi:hypothetical protein